MVYKSNNPEGLVWSVKINLNEDFKNIIIARMDRIGISPSNIKDCVYEYFNLQKRLVSRKSRIVKKSNEFICPKEYVIALEELENKIAEGLDLVPYMSKNILKSNFNDGLLNDWNIYHFHLTRRFGVDGFAKRSDYELFIYFTEKFAYLIQIYPHNKKNLYSTQEMVKILYENWPELLEKNHIKDIMCLSENINDETYEKLRDKNISTLVQIGEQKVFGFIGGGYMSNEFSTEALNRSDYCFDVFKTREEVFINNIEPVLNGINMVTDKLNFNLDIRLLWLDSDEKITLFEKANTVVIQLDFKLGQIRVCQPYELFGFNH